MNLSAAKHRLKRRYICIAPHCEKLASEALRYGSHNFVTLQTHHTSLYFVSIHQKASPLSSDGSHLIAFIDPRRMKGWDYRLIRRCLIANCYVCCCMQRVRTSAHRVRCRRRWFQRAAPAMSTLLWHQSTLPASVSFVSSLSYCT